MTAAVRYGIPNINDTPDGHRDGGERRHMIVFTTGAGSVVGQAVAPVIKVVSNSRVYQRLADDMDVNAGTHRRRRRDHRRGRRAHPGQSRRRRRGRADPVGGARPSGIRAELQDLRAARPELPAALRPRGSLGEGAPGRDRR